MLYALYMQLDDESTIDFGKTLKRVRQRAGLDQGTLASQVGTDQSTLSRIERGQKPRKSLQNNLLNFIESQNTKEPAKVTQLMEVIADSKELRALVIRIIKES